MDLDSATSTSASKKSLVYENVSLDKALELTGYGRYNYAVIASSALALLSVGLQYGLSAYMLPAANCELQLQSSEIGFINVAFLIGGASGALLWGVLADLTGRRKILVITLLADVIITLCCSLMQNFYGLVVCRFFNGFLIGAPGSITYTYLAEYHAPQHRTRSIFLPAFFNTLAWLMLPVVAWMILPYEIHVQIGDFVLFSSWRVFLIILALPELIAGLWFLYLPETPKYLATDFANGSQKACNAAVQCSGKIARLIQEISSQLKRLFKEPFWRLTLLLGVITFTNMFGYFGLGLWFPQLLTRYQEKDNITTTDNGADASCQFHFNLKLFGSTFTMGISSLFTTIFSGLLSGQFGQHIIPLTLMLTGAISAASFYWTNSLVYALIAASVFQSSMSTSNVALGSVVVELFPTSINAMAVCSSMFFGRVGAIISNLTFGFLVDNHEKVAIGIVSVTLFIGTFLCILIPREQKPQQDISKSSIELSVISNSSL